MAWRLIAAISVCMIALGCSSSRVFLEPDYQNKSFGKPSIGIILLDQNPRVQYDGNVENEFGPGEQDALIIRYFRTRIPALVRTNTVFKVKADTVAFDAGASSGMVSEQQDGPMYGYPIPRAGTQFEVAGSVPDFVLLINNLSIGTLFSSSPGTMVMSPGGGMMMTGGTAKKELKCVSDVVLWDNGAKKVALYGNVRASASGFFPVITMGTWESVTEEYVGDLFENTPFGRER